MKKCRIGLSFKRYRMSYVFNFIPEWFRRIVRYHSQYILRNSRVWADSLHDTRYYNGHGIKKSLIGLSFTRYRYYNEDGMK